MPIYSQFRAAKICRKYLKIANVIEFNDDSNSARFTAKFELVFVLTQENASSQKFHFKANRKSIGSSKERY